jgi:hypothetical protein
LQQREFSHAVTGQNVAGFAATEFLPVSRLSERVPTNSKAMPSYHFHQGDFAA